MGFPLTLSGQTAPAGSQGGTSLSTQLDQATDPNSGPREGKCKQLIDTSEPLGSSKPVNNTESDIHSVDTSEPQTNDPIHSVDTGEPQSKDLIHSVDTSKLQSNDPTSSSLRPKCFRISGLPSSWSEIHLFDALHEIDQSLTRHNYRPSLYPSCYGSTQTALLNLDPCTVYLQSRNHFPIPKLASRTADVLTIDSDFYNLTPLNILTGEVVAELVVRPLETSWRC